MEDQDHHQILREMTGALKREMEFYRELKRRQMVFSMWNPKAKLTPQQELAYWRSTCEPELREVAKMVLEEVEYNRKQRRMACRYTTGVMLFVITIAVTMPFVIVWAVDRYYPKIHIPR